MKHIVEGQGLSNRETEAVDNFLDLVARLVARAHHRDNFVAESAVTTDKQETLSPSAPKIAKLVRKQRRRATNRSD